MANDAPSQIGTINCGRPHEGSSVSSPCQQSATCNASLVPERIGTTSRRCSIDIDPDAYTGQPEVQEEAGETSQVPTV